MTREEAIRILDPETAVEELLKIEYYGGFGGRTKAAQAVSDACILAVAALLEQEERSKPKESQQSDGHIPMTNADRIRSMSDEELAAFLCKKFGCHSETCPGIELCKPNEGKANGILKWLQQPAEPPKEE